MFSRRAISKSLYLIRQFTLGSSAPRTFNGYPSVKPIPSKCNRGNLHRGPNVVSTRILSAFAVGVAGITFWHVNDNNVVFAESVVHPSVEETTEEPESKIHIPNHLTLYNGARAILVGLGIRTVSFLQMKVYVIGMYISEDDIEILKNWKGYDKEKFLLIDDDSLAYELLSQPVDIAIRIEPVRNTNGQHLRDGFARTLTNRMQDGYLREDEVKQALEALKEFKSKFPKTSIKAGTSMILTKQKDGNLRMEYEGRDFGVIESSWLAKNLFMGYLAANDPISKEAKDSIAEGLEKMLIGD